MERKGHGTIKKSKAYGAIGTLLLSGVLIATLGTASVSADETTVTVENDMTELVADSSATEAENNEVATETAVVGEEASQETVTVDDDQETVSEDNQADVQGQEVADTTTDSETLETSSSDSVESSQTTTDTEISDSEAEQAEDVTTDTQDSAQTDEQQATVEEATDNETVERGATGNATNEVTSVSLASNGFNLQYNQAIASGAKIMFAVWSDVKGQDDLVWYTADSNGKATAKYTGSYGKYNVHTYQNLNGKMTGLNGTTIDVPKPSAKVSITKASATTYKVTVTDVPVYITSVTLPTWTENKGQDDIIWYKTTKDSTTTYSATISVAEHNLESGKYNVHVYGTSAVTNSLTGLTGTSFQGDYAFGDVAVSASLAQTGINITMPSDVSQGMTVYHAVWSAKNDQDDIVWYKVPSNGQLTAKYTGDYGTYLIHTYGVVKGQMVCLSATSIDVPKPSAKATITKESATTYKVTVTDVPVYIDSIQIPTWTEKSGQDDIQWYKATKAADGSYYVIFSEATHNLEAGTYNVHVYGNSRVTNSLTGLLGTRFIADYQYGDVQVQASLGEKGIYITMPSDVSTNLTVYHAVWSTKNNQDDLKWYKVDHSGKTTATYTGDYGPYLIHTYAVVKGQMQIISATSIDVPKPEVKVSITKVSDTSAKVTVTDVPVYIHDIQLPTWTSKNNQDDLKWYKAAKQSDGSYTYTFYAKNHNFETGHYNVHVYGTSEVTHSFVALSGSDGIDLTFNQSLTNPTATVQNQNAANGTLQVVIAETETSKDIASVSVAAWSDPNQKNIHWYTSSSVSNGKVVITVDEKYHHNLLADYTIHVYVKTKDGETIGYNLGQYVLNNKQTTASVSTSYKGTGVYGVTVSGVYSSGTVKYAVWSDTNGQDDIKWYDATTSGTTATGLINVTNHSGTGTYHVHVYQYDNGQMYFLTSTDFTVKRTNYSTPYYNQRDGRWGGNRYGYYTLASTGCVPTSLAMVFSSLTGSEVLPTTVASYLYNNTVEFNRGTEGTTGNGILVASRQWGLTPTVLNSSAALTSALQEGHHVVAAVQQDKFSPWGWGTSHEIVLKGYSNGNTYVSDPYNSANNGWYPIVSLWNEQSTQSVDTSGLGNPFVKITDI
ncbi:cell surface protein [Streptococcus macedonicus]|uniref:Cell surface protein n=1 Tax=Streptococcus macedonicus TaxID=59310 RepID=A0A2G3NVI9_STRMC|nr:GBS Bsp-like repeat-containing protein [Streptococcus macedonicus]PHV57509.1 cell surface protein [Streptococcus macedonicus]